MCKVLYFYWKSFDQ